MRLAPSAPFCTRPRSCWPASSEAVRLPYGLTTAASERMLLEELGDETRAASERLAELAAGAAGVAGAAHG
ncbi:MAG: hypothetical protein LBJ87_11415 [bacterium]|nr:hypothetical protein [bacterium]